MAHSAIDQDQQAALFVDALAEAGEGLFIVNNPDQLIEQHIHRQPISQKSWPTMTHEALVVVFDVTDHLADEGPTFGVLGQGDVAHRLID